MSAAPGGDRAEAPAQDVAGPAGFEIVRFGPDGLVPAIVQDATSHEVLMMAYMNEESLRRTLATKRTWFWSRSRGELWPKGETSGNRQRVRAVLVDCDGDTLVVEVDQEGTGACHTGARSCFARRLEV
ncbi:MAG: phosphoribosyl-AMP cyclohydrolase [Acidimicrobiales bacterium]